MHNHLVVVRERGWANHKLILRFDQIAVTAHISAALVLHFTDKQYIYT